MNEFETLLGLILAAVVLAAIARKLGVPYPAFLALGGVALAFFPGAPMLRIEPQLVLALFVAPVLLDSAYDASPRDLRDNWVPLVNLVVIGVALTTVAVAWIVRVLVPAIPWAAAVALGAIVAPPDATAAVTVLRHVRPPHRILTILEGESLLNDASALLIYRLAVGALAAKTFSFNAVAPTFLLAVVGSIVAAPILAWMTLGLTRRIRDVPTAIILQFITTFGIWIFADRIGLSGILTVVCFAVVVARRAPALTPARIRIPSYAVWDTVIFVVNVLAFVFIGLQVGPIWTGLDPMLRRRYLLVVGAVLLTITLVRFAWVLLYYVVVRWRIRRFGFHPRGTRQPPSLAGALIVSWSGLRGIVSLAAALALPMLADGSPFPFRDLIVFTAFGVVLGTLVIQGLTLGPLLRALNLHDDRLVDREVCEASNRALEAALATLDGDSSEAARAVNLEVVARLRPAEAEPEAHAAGTLNHDELMRRALAAARTAVFDMRATNAIGDAAFHRLEEEFDWMEMGAADPDER